ncbi:hypothetical protein BC937DRAFT_94244 [Endogone sp. FLAS-F59071]|nr:hypothetical protein BC937DRAFT_94244 [Endogone sp. FLAS-F59071]|eukprot:RUS22976.1 hypothetical protein BC937DRAFT_94244 [Endogone sp. FLAS-F59071]
MTPLQWGMNSWLTSVTAPWQDLEDESVPSSVLLASFPMSINSFKTRNLLEIKQAATPTFHRDTRLVNVGRDYSLREQQRFKTGVVHEILRCDFLILGKEQILKPGMTNTREPGHPSTASHPTHNSPPYKITLKKFHSPPSFLIPLERILLDLNTVLGDDKNLKAVARLDVTLRRRGVEAASASANLGVGL